MVFPIKKSPAVEQLAGAVKVVVTGPQFLKVFPSLTVMLGIVAKAIKDQPLDWKRRMKRKDESENEMRTIKGPGATISGPF